MLSHDLQQHLVNHSVKTSGHLDRRGYIGLSEMGDCDQVVYDHYCLGRRSTVSERLKFCLVYDLAAALIARLKALNLYSPAHQICLFQGMVRGHPDGYVGGDLLEIKTIEMERWFPEVGRVPNRVFYQTQSYLHYTGVRYAHVVYLARDTGAIKVLGITRNERVGQMIEGRLERLVEAVTNHRRPACSCGHCQDRDQP